MLPNWIPDTNKFHLSGPPKWWLKKLWDFDNSLVVVPSRQDFVYRLAQRRKPNLTDDIVKDALFNASDTKMLASYGLIPVTSIVATANWGNPAMFEELRRRAPWRQFNSSADAIAAVEGQETQEELRKREQTDENLTHLSKDAWKYYKKKIGLRTSIDMGAGKPTQRG